MSERPHRPEILPYMSKVGRIEEAQKSGVLDTHRFSLTTDPHLREKIKILREVFRKLHASYPEIMGFTLFGSIIKGYAINKDSDIDLNVYLNEDKIRAKSDKESRNKPVFALPLYEQIHNDIHTTLATAGFTDTELKSRERVICESEIAETLRRHLLNANIVSLFELAIGKDLYDYRKLVISTLEKMGERGENAWLDIMWELSARENLFFSHRFQRKRLLLYPKTLVEGRKYFLSNGPKGLREL